MTVWREKFEAITIAHAVLAAPVDRKPDSVHYAIVDRPDDRFVILPE